MTATRYDVIYRGKIIAGFEPETAKQNLVKIFSISAEKAEKILNSKRMALKRNTDEATAKKFGIALKKAGLDVALTKSAEMRPAQETPAVPPAEGEAESSEAAVKKAPPVEETSKETAVPAVAAKPAGRIPFEFRGNGSEYFKIWLVNIILTIITIGIYSPWAKVRRKQYFYGSSRVHGASFEYLADPVKILKGRIIIVAILLIHQLISRLNPILGSILALGFAIIFPWLMVRSLAFNARYSSWRNIRFGFDGTAWEWAKVYMLWPFVAVLTLGILFPYVYFRQRKFIVENHSYGATKFKFTATAKDYYRLYFSALIPIIIGLALLGATFFFFPPAGVLIGVVLYLYLFAFFSVKTTNLLYSSSGLGAQRLEANLEVKGYMGLVFTNSLATAFTLSLFHPWAKVRTARYKAEHLTLLATGDLDGFIAVEQKQVSALGEEAADFFDFDIGL